MGKEKPGCLTAKAISNKIKSKGLQKLRWFCQMCNKQCRDENGFKCHITSESHHRQMLLFDQNADKFVGNFTSQFMKGYLDILKRQFGGKRTNANFIYQEYIKDKDHVHMNSTKFTTLTGFINCLHKMGICKVDNNEKGWFIEYIDTNPEQEYKDKKKRRMERSEKNDDESFFTLFEKSKKSKLSDEINQNKPTTSNELIKNSDETITMNFSTMTKSVNDSRKHIDDVFDKYNSDDDKNVDNTEYISNTKEIKSSKLPLVQKVKTVVEYPKQDDRVVKHIRILEEMKAENEKEKELKNRKRNWLFENIVVKLVDENLPKDLYKQNAYIREVENRFTAIVKTLNIAGGNKKLKVNQECLMTVIPKVGDKVFIVNGAYRGTKATLMSIDKSKFTASLRCTSGFFSNSIVDKISFDDFSQFYERSQ